MDPRGLILALLVVSVSVWGVNETWGPKTAWLLVAAILLGTLLYQRAAFEQITGLIAKATGTPDGSKT